MTVLVQEKRRKMVKAGKSHFWEYYRAGFNRLYPADNTGSKSRLPTLFSMAKNNFLL